MAEQPFMTCLARDFKLQAEFCYGKSTATDQAYKLLFLFH
ncbi:MAG: hypothetical protein ACI8T1_003905 [Verrucomicrobiales bacterium]